MPLANLANVLGGGNDESSGVTPGSFSSVTSSGGSFIGANGQTIVGSANGAWAVNANGGSGIGTTFTNGSSFNFIKVESATNAQVIIVDTSATADNKNYGFRTEATGQLSLRAYIDTFASSNPFILFNRTGSTVNSVIVPITVSSTTPITGAFRVGNDTAATTVGIGAGNVTIGNILGVPGAAVPVLTTATTITSGAAAQVGTLTNSPTAGNPTKWIPINDAGVTRYFPAW